ncbi:MAG: response regulator [Pirellulales bacterium]|nr:response regulator [Pirellulales bacterium]
MDDEPLICSMLEIFLGRAGYDVEIAPDGAQAIAMIEDSPVDLVIADIVMPEKDGLETIMQLRQQYPSLHIIAISGGSRIGNFDFLSMAAKLGASETFYKPLDNEKLLAAVNQCMKTPRLVLAEENQLSC